MLVFLKVGHPYAILFYFISFTPKVQKASPLNTRKHTVLSFLIFRHGHLTFLNLKITFRWNLVWHNPLFPAPQPNPHTLTSTDNTSLMK